ncbi:hypothetical protein ACKI1K_44120, partial [Streptomyces scabiei]|uniref:hypothetical protein n=1 Tax=Streptomyces scabiei TaxID=1930 RepID=UPI0038F63174
TLFDSIFAAARAAGIYVAVNFIDRTFGSAVTTLPGGVYPKWWTWGTSGTEMVQLPPGGTGNPGSLQSVAAYWNSNTYNAMMAAYTDFCNRYQNEP